MTLVVVATTLVSDARSKIVSSVIGSSAGTTARCADRLLIEDAVAAPDEHDGAGQLLLGDGVADQRLDRVEPARIDRNRRRSGGSRPPAPGR